MITNNFKGILQAILPSGYGKGAIPVTAPNGSNVFLATSFNSNQAFPYALPTIYSGSNYEVAGIYLGNGDAAFSPEDYALANKISSGLSVNLTAFNNGTDDNGNPYRQITIEATNSTASEILIKEIGYVVNVYLASSVGGNSSLGRLLIDRTVLDSPIAVPASGTVTFNYVLKTVIS